MIRMANGEELESMKNESTYNIMNRSQASVSHLGGANFYFFFGFWLKAISS